MKVRVGLAQRKSDGLDIAGRSVRGGLAQRRNDVRERSVQGARFEIISRVVDAALVAAYRMP